MKPIVYDGPGQNPVAHKIVSTAGLDASDNSRIVIDHQLVKEQQGESRAAKLLLGENPVRDSSFSVRCCPVLSWETRVMGFLSCFAIGVALSLSSLLTFPMLLAGDPTPFAWKYSVGNVLSLASSTLIVGPHQQWEQMASPVRVGASAVYVLSIVMTVAAALMLHNTILTLAAMLVQTGALGWYCASYIPFGRTFIRMSVQRICCPV